MKQGPVGPAGQKGDRGKRGDRVRKIKIRINASYHMTHHFFITIRVIQDHLEQQVPQVCQALKETLVQQALKEHQERRVEGWVTNISSLQDGFKLRFFLLSIPGTRWLSRIAGKSWPKRNSSEL